MSSESPDKPHGPRAMLVYAPFGLLPALLGGVLVLLADIMVSMSPDRDLEGWDRFLALFQKEMPLAVVCVTLVIGGLGFTMLCVVYAATGWERCRPTVAKLLVLVLGVLVPLALALQ